jgi:hypothetical protein
VVDFVEDLKAHGGDLAAARANGANVRRKKSALPIL